MTHEPAGGNPPRLTLGLPVFNGAGYIRQTLESMKAQTFQDYELLVSDNGSDDETERIVKEFAAADTRIRYYRHAENIGAHKNYNSIVPRSRSEYFKWVAHDDLLAPTYLERCVAALDEQPAVVLAFCNATQIDENGDAIGLLTSNQTYDSRSPYSRMRAYIADRTRSPQVFGVFRRSALVASHLLPSYSKSDIVFMCEMAMLGQWMIIEEPLFLNREHPDRQGRLALRDRTHWYFPSRQAPLMARWAQWGGMVSIAWRVPMPIPEKAKCLGFAAYWGLSHPKDLVMDLVHRAKYEIGRVAGAFRRK